ncbi:hypothetical protein CBR_g38870 [Chara braunii]|uniref:Uncharacterized protein n=1 Tax=Chara braunii TaxID=69332 RepID=A0A388LQJ6_CHABU|nr:hypothetical protein CBR_g38870 [Chara braunii]|eukprot:GBG84587.1 hypothetical protein CBR_g38870 [Chara braunii]
MIKCWCPALNTSGWRDGRNRKTTKRKGRKGRRERKKKRAEFFDNEKVVKFATKIVTGAAKLTEVIVEIKGKSRREVISSGGRIWAEDWGVIKRRFGDSDLQVGELNVKLKRAKSYFEEGDLIRFLRVRERKPRDPKMKKQLHQLLKCPWKKKKLDELGLEELSVLFQNIKSFSRKATRKSLKTVLDGVVKRKFNVSFRRRVVVGAKYDERILMAEIRKTVVGKIVQGCRSETEARIRCQKLRLVWRKKQTVGDLLHNHRRMSRQMESVCCCAGLDLPRQGEHVSFRLSSRSNVDPRVMNSKNVIQGCDSRDDDQKLCPEMNNEMVKNGIDSVWTIQEARNCMRERKDRKNGLLDSIEEVKERWGGLVFCPLDKNSAETLVLYPVSYESGMRESFWGNDAFEAVWREEEVVMARAKRDYEGRGLKKIGKWNNQGSWGKAYILPKHKASTKSHPISPSFNEPAKMANQRIAKALNFLLNSLPVNDHFNLKSTNLLKSKLEGVNKWAKKRKQGEIMGVAYDIKEMFSKLPHETVKQAVRWILTFFANKGREFVLVKEKEKGATFGYKKGEEG